VLAGIFFFFFAFEDFSLFHWTFLSENWKIKDVKTGEKNCPIILLEKLCCKLLLKNDFPYPRKTDFQQSGKFDEKRLLR
jgi:hypothetical protein